MGTTGNPEPLAAARQAIMDAQAELVLALDAAWREMPATASLDCNHAADALREAQRFLFAALRPASPPVTDTGAGDSVEAYRG